MLKVLPGLHYEVLVQAEALDFYTAPLWHPFRGHTSQCLSFINLMHPYRFGFHFARRWPGLILL